MQWHRSGLIASWEFMEEHIERANVSDGLASNKPLVEKHTERKWGAMVVIKSLQYLPEVISAALRETTHNTHEVVSNNSLEPTSHGNMLHIALVGVNNQMCLLQDRYVCFWFSKSSHVTTAAHFYSFISFTFDPGSQDC